MELQKVKLGKTDIFVTVLCFGTLPMGPLQTGLSVKEGSEIIKYAILKGINFIDTAELYQTYPHIREAVKKINKKVVIATKSLAANYKDMEKSIKKALKEMKLEYIDIFHLHAARANKNVFEEREGALRCLVDYKNKGKIRAVGISTHSVEVVRETTKRKEIDIIFPLFNKTGLGIIGKKEEMLKEIKKAKRKGYGIYAMKVLAGGNLLQDFENAINFVKEKNLFESISLGMVSKKEVDINVDFFLGKKIKLPSFKTIKRLKKIVIIPFCKGCGSCIEVCPQNAISLGSDKKAKVDEAKCLLCGYCASACPEFFIRIA
jgi:aryl-alcohol dehydrogenase-like predicted oxidoreductase/NAD-dependent dihydropyrimidine dehydrogenase PreA subunit